jgi:magnesium chelatase subunit D
VAAVVLPDRALHQIARVCAAFDVDGMRADLVTARTAIALAAWHGRGVVTAEDVRQAALLALPHRKRRNPFDAPGLDEDALDEALASAADNDDDPSPDDDAGPSNEGSGPDNDSGGPDDGGGGSDDGGGPDGGGGPDDGGGPDNDGGPDGGGDPAPDHRGANAPQPRTVPRSAPVDQVQSAAEPYRARLLTVPGIGSGAAGRRSRAETTTGRTTGSRRRVAGATGQRLHVTATLMAAAPHQRLRGRTGSGVLVRADDVRMAVREGREGNLVLFVVDASGSMAARQRMRAVKGAVLSLLLDAYQRRDKVGLVTFRGTTAELALPPTSSVEVGAARLSALPTGGRTPIAAGLLMAHNVLRRERLKDPRRRPLVVLVTDGRATGKGHPLADAQRAAALLAGATAGGSAGSGTACIVVDCEAGGIRLGLAGSLAQALAAPVLRLDELGAEHLTAVVHATRPDRKVA